MKTLIRIFIVLFPLIIIFTGCNDNHITSSNNTTEGTKMNTIYTENREGYVYSEGRYSARMWDKDLIAEINSNLKSSNNIVSDADSAISIATVHIEEQ